MDLELVRFTYSFNTDPIGTKRICCMLLQHVIGMTYRDQLDKRVFPNQIALCQLQSVTFHQEDAYTLGLKVGDIL